MSTVADLDELAKGDITTMEDTTEVAKRDTATYSWPAHEDAIDSSKRAQVDLTFNDIKYAVQVKKETKPILHGISGTVKNGTMCCILGPSGSGKTSLIHIISSKLASGPGRDVSGAVLCNQQELTASQFQRISGLVTQEDIFNAALTVKETLMFAAKLKLTSQHAQRVEQVVKLLQLENCLPTYVGDDSNPYLKGISGGEKRRLAIAVEILDPDISLLVLDEPTSGLDSAAALNVANLLRSLANRGIAVVASLHQPRASIVSNFEALMVLADGRRVFYGHLKEYLPYLLNDLQCELPQHDNPYDFLLDVLNPLVREQSTFPIRAIPQDCPDVTNALADKFDQSVLRAEMDATASQLNATDMQQSIKRRQSVSWFFKFLTILHRTFLIKMRDPMVMMTQLSSGLMFGIIFGGLYWQSYDKKLEFAILDTQMLIQMSTMMAIWMPYDVTLTFPKERQIFLRERKAGLYSTSAFYCARISADMPMHIVAALIMAIIIYPMGGLQQGLHLFLAINILGILIGAAIMQMIGALSRTFEEANILMMIIMMLSMVMSTGFLREVPAYLEWMREISLMGLVADLGMYAEFRDIDPKYGSPDEVLINYGVRITSDDDAWSALGVLLAIYLVARVLCYLAVKFLFTGRSFAENLAD
jgi:ABC-type multidrug transport system ATPase subunit